jgi:anti-sigma B factor antagonist
MDLRFEDGLDEGDIQVLVVSGELDLATAPGLGARLFKSLADGARYVILDMTDVSLVDSTGIGVLLSAQRRIRASDGDLVVAHVRDNVGRVFAVTGVGRALNLRPSVADALEFVGALEGRGIVDDRTHAATVADG